MSRRWLTSSLSLLAAGILAAGPASAAQRRPPPELIHYLKSPDHMKAVMATIRHEAAQIPDCHLSTVDSIQIFVPGPVTFDAKGQPASGGWKESWTIKGCSQSGVFNVMTLVDNEHKVRLLGMLPGLSHADPVMQKAGLPYAFRAARKAIPADCKEGAVIDTAFLGFTGAPVAKSPSGPNARAWREKWTLLSCGKQIPVLMRFVPDATGMTIRSDGIAPE